MAENKWMAYDQNDWKSSLVQKPHHEKWWKLSYKLISFLHVDKYMHRHKHNSQYTIVLYKIMDGIKYNSVLAWSIQTKIYTKTNSWTEWIINKKNVSASFNCGKNKSICSEQ